jgi:hypothetical protein
MRLVFLALLVLVLATAAASAQTEILDELGQQLRWSSAGGLAQLQVTGLFDIEGYRLDQQAPGLIFGGNDDFANPRLWLFLDGRLGDHLSTFVELRADRGFDPREDSASVRFDEYRFRYTFFFEDARIALQIGKFPTFFGNWVGRHDSWENPLINAPLPYENVTIVADRSAPTSPANFLTRRNSSDKKRQWLPIIWGPSYTSGAAMLGAWRQLEFEIEFKNASLASRPDEWDFRYRGWNHPTVTGRVGWNPEAAWQLGVSASRGSYLLESATSTLPAGKHIGDYPHTLFGADAGYAWRHLQVWGEFFASRFEVPNVEGCDAVAYYVESKYQVAPQWYGALRWNQALFEKISNGEGREITWDRNAWRIDTAIGYRFDRHVQYKLQYSLDRQSGYQQQGEQTVAMQLTFRF